MWTTLAFVTALALTPGQADQGESLKLSNFRATYGHTGPERTDLKFLPGDALFVAFDIENLKVLQGTKKIDDESKVKYKMGLEMRAKGAKNPTYKHDPGEVLEAYLPLGGDRLPGFGFVEIPTDTKPGDYSIKITVIDWITKNKTQVSHTQNFEVLPKEFGIVKLSLAYGYPGGGPAPPVGVVGQTFWVSFLAGFFQRDENSKQPDLTLELHILDEEGAKTVKRFTRDFPGKEGKVPMDVPLVPMQFQLHLNRPGKFTVKLKAKDNAGKKETERIFKLTVLESK